MKWKKIVTGLIFFLSEDEDIEMRLLPLIGMTLSEMIE